MKHMATRTTESDSSPEKIAGVQGFQLDPGFQLDRIFFPGFPVGPFQKGVPGWIVLRQYHVWM